MNIPQMLSHRGSETHMYVINNAKDLRLKMTTGCSHEPRDGGSCRLVLLWGAAGEGLEGGCPKSWPHAWCCMGWASTIGGPSTEASPGTPSGSSVCFGEVEDAPRSSDSHKS